MNKKRVVQWFVRWTDSWNREFHEAIERNVQNESKSMFPNGTKDTEATIENMRGFYYARMTNKSTLLVSILALIVAFLALVVSLVSVLPALLHK